MWSRWIVQSNPQSNGSKRKGNPSFQEDYFTFQTYSGQIHFIYLHPTLEITTSGSFLSFSLLCSWLASMTIGSPLVPCPKRRIHVDDTDGSRYGGHVLWKIHILSYMICIVASSIIFLCRLFKGSCIMVSDCLLHHLRLSYSNGISLNRILYYVK